MLPTYVSLRTNQKGTENVHTPNSMYVSYQRNQAAVRNGWVADGAGDADLRADGNGWL